MFSILIGVVLIITLSFTTATAFYIKHPCVITPSFAAAGAGKTFNVMPADTSKVMDTVKIMKSDDAVDVLILGYTSFAEYKDVPSLVDSVMEVRKFYLNADIDKDRTTLAFVIGQGNFWKKYNFEKDGVYIKLFRK